MHQNRDLLGSIINWKREWLNLEGALPCKTEHPQVIDQEGQNQVYDKEPLMFIVSLDHSIH